MKLCVLTYDAPHLKTSEVSMNLYLKGWGKIDFMVFPFTKRPQRAVTFSHRPFQFAGPDLHALAGFLGSKILPYDEWESALDRYDYFIVCGAGLINEPFANSGKVINCHPGLLPVARGLDAFKWSVLNNKRVGNTLHIIDSNVDSGEVISHSQTPCFVADSIGDFAERHYRREIFMLSNFDHFLKSGTIKQFKDTAGEPTGRMSSTVEEDMLRNFEGAFKKRFALGPGASAEI